MIKKYLKNESIGVLLIFLGLSTLLTIASPNFLTVDNLSSVTRSFSYVAIMAIGMTMVIITGGIDLSVGSIFAFASVITAACHIKFGINLSFSILIGIASGIGCGLING